MQAAIELQKQISLYNSQRQAQGNVPISLGIGINTGRLIFMLVTVDNSQRMETTLIGEVINQASRLESLTKVYGVNILISENTLLSLNTPQNYHCRFIDRVPVKSKNETLAVFGVYDKTLNT